MFETRPVHPIDALYTGYIIAPYVHELQIGKPNILHFLEDAYMTIAIYIVIYVLIT